MTSLSTSSSTMTKVRQVLQHFDENSGLWLMFAGLAIMFMPTLWSLIIVNGLWTDDEHSHGPIILCISLWLLWKRWSEIPNVASYKPSPTLAWVCEVGSVKVPSYAILKAVYAIGFLPALLPKISIDS